jgi:predicted DNA-binding protein
VPRGTTLRNVRISDDLWNKAKAKAAQQGRTLSDVIREALERFVK